MIVLLTLLPTPYRIPLFNRIAERLASRDQRFHVLFKNPSIYKRRQWSDALREARFDYSVMNLPKIRLGYDKVVNLPVRVAQAFEGLDPSCIVLPGFDMVALSVMAYARKRDIPIVVWSGGTQADFNLASAKPIRRAIRNRIVRNAASFVAYGSETKRYLQSLGAPAQLISIGINSVDTDYYQTAVAQCREELARDDRRIHILYVGHLQRRKGLDLVLRALAEMKRSDVVLDVIGEGPERTEYESLIAQLGLDSVRFHGFKQKDELPRYYAGADFLVFPSTEELFGLVMVEAAAAGLPIIASKFAGATADVVHHGLNGYVVDPTDISEMAARMSELCDDQTLRATMGEQSLKVVAGSVNINRSADGFVEAIARAMGWPMVEAATH